MERQHWMHCSYFITVVLFALNDGIRLSDKITECAGRVEFSNMSRVCGGDWSLKEAEVLCRQLSCGKAEAARPIGSDSPFEGIRLKCTGKESSLTNCESSGGTCSQGDAGVVCSHDFPKPVISVVPPGVNWGGTISITCDISKFKKISELTQGVFKLTKNSIEIKQSSVSHKAIFTESKVKFEDKGQYQCCYKETSPGFCSPVSFTVTVDLPVPSLCVSPPAGGHCSSDTVHITRGDSFVLHCSVSSDVPEGLFLLWFSGSNSSVHQPSVNHSTSFHFPVSQSQHQGQYSCVYQVTGAGHTYTSPISAVVNVIVKKPLLPIILPVVAVSLLLLVLIGLYLLHRRRRRHVVELTNSAPAPMNALNRYEDSDDEDDADYVNAPNGGEDEDSEEPDYVNVTAVHDNDIVEIYGGDNDSIYQNC
uniref:Leleenin n=1 Tax=Boleophthalmus pectinirostris TaxID=150288 RepID=A0AA49B0W8_BOLPE|nr:leleenin [Boleophthalmus pectinirostris]